MPTRLDIGDATPTPGGPPNPGGYHHVIRARLVDLAAADPAQRGELLAVLGAEFLQAAARGNPDTIEVFLAGGMDVNFQDARTGQTALHAAAAAQARQAVRALLKARGLDFLLRDAQGRLASEHAYRFGGDPALARLLGNKERKQARAQKLIITRRATFRN